MQLTAKEFLRCSGQKSTAIARVCFPLMVISLRSNYVVSVTETLVMEVQYSV
jgi:hypothetical protein